MKALKFTTIQAPNQDFIIQKITSYIGKRLAIKTAFIGDAPWQERERLFDAGQVDIAWICGLPYINKVFRNEPALELLAGPVMLAKRYRNQPVYFSDVIVRRESKYQKFEDLRGARWAYNEPTSHSGYNITRYTLAKLGFNQGFFGSAIEAGSHQKSIKMVMSGAIDAAAIDSTVLELERDRDARLGDALRIISSLGPSPIPPLVILTSVEPALRLKIRQALIEMHHDEEGLQILSSGKIKRLAALEDKAYDLIREMARLAQDVSL